ncbi:hypothetical protein Tco_0877100 [Tanacetum coccineum]|uniref:Uncharacterized protein n=1 Tax=Tanacetum coccineum TaxID=301880 RepID=A0ABQ5BVX2_9ASTR
MTTLPSMTPDGSVEVHHSENCYDNDIFNMFTQEEHVEQSGGIVEQNPATVEEIRALYDLYNNLVIEVEKVNKHESPVVYDLEEILQLAQESCLKMKQLNKEIKPANYAKINQHSKVFVSQKAKSREELYFSNTSKMASVSNSISNPISIPNEEFSDDTSLKADASLVKHKALEFENERLLRAVFSQDNMSIVRNNSVVDTSNLQTGLDRDLKGKSSNTQCASNILDSLSQKLDDENVSLEFQVLNYAKENKHLKTIYKNLFNSIKVTRAQTKIITDSLQEKLHETIYENATLRAQLFDKVSEQQDTSNGTSVNTKFTKQSILGKPPSSSESKLYSVTPLPKSKVIPKVGETNALSKPVTLNSAPSSRESIVVNNERVIAPEILRINPFKASRIDNFVPNNKSN